MFLRARDRQIRLPRTQYSLSVLRGRSIRTVSFSAKLFWSLAALVPLSLAIGLAGSGGLAIERWAVRPEIEIVQIRGAADADAGDAASRAAEWQALLRRAAIETEVRDLLAREARLEQREAMVAALAAEAARGTTVAPSAGSKAGVSAIGAIERLSPRAGGEPQRAGYEADGGRAYAPSPGVIQEPKSSGPLSRNDGPQVTRANFSASRSLSGPWTDVDAESGLDVLRRSLSRVESDQMTLLDALDRTASQSSSHNAAILSDAGLDPTKLLAPNSAAGAGGPYVPAWTDADAPVFDRAVAHVARDVALAQRLRALIPFVPLRQPLRGETVLTSPFGYRVDPFLGKLALHSGVDLLQAYGSAIRATAAGRVLHAGPMGGYGAMVEIDHGNGLSTRYAHMSEIVVKEGQEVAEGAILGSLGSSGRSTGPHLHYEVRVDGEPVDPERFLRAGEELTATE